MGRRRNAMFFAAALVAHAAVVILLPRARIHPPPKPPPDEMLWLDTAPTGHATDGTGALATTTTRTSSRARRSGTVTVTIPGRTETETESGTGTEAESGTGTESGSLSSLLLSQDIGLRGSGSYRMDVARQQPSDSETANENANHAIMDAIHANEILNGDFTTGPVVKEIESTTRNLAGTPFEGRAVFAVRVDELGLVLSVGVDEASGDRREWNEVATHVLNALAQRRLRMPHGAKGVAMRIEVTSKVALPSGSRVPLHVGSPAADAVSKMVKGEFDKAPDTPAIIGGSFDLSDIGAHPMRMVGAHIVSASVY